MVGEENLVSYRLLMVHFSLKGNRMFKKSLTTKLLGMTVATALGVFSVNAGAAAAEAASEPIRIGVMSYESAPQGLGNIQGIQLAADQINDAGGINGRPIKLYVLDTQGSATVAVRNFQRLVKEDKVVAVMGTWGSEVSLAVQPWASRFKIPFLVGTSGSPEITRNVHADYEKNKYTFALIGNSVMEAEDICKFAKERLTPLGAKTAVLLDEDAQWTIELIKSEKECLPTAGIKILDVIKFANNTSDFSPIFNKIRSLNPNLIITGLSHTGLQATIQWSQQKVPALMVGMNSIAISKDFIKQSNGAGEGVITQSGLLEGIRLTDKTLPYFEAFQKKFGPAGLASLAASTYDGMYIYADAVKRAGTTDADAVIKALEETNYDGVERDHIKFYGKDSPFTHQANLHFPIMQWQSGKRVYVYPMDVAQKIELPDFVKWGK